MPFEVPDIFGHTDWMLIPQYWFRLGVNDATNGGERQVVEDYQAQYDEGYDFALYQRPYLYRAPYV